MKQKKKKKTVDGRKKRKGRKKEGKNLEIERGGVGREEMTMNSMIIISIISLEMTKASSGNNILRYHP